MRNRSQVKAKEMFLCALCVTFPIDTIFNDGLTQVDGIKHSAIETETGVDEQCR